MIRDEQAQAATGGWHAALAGAALGAGLAAWWVMGDLVSIGASKEAVTVRPMPRTEQAQAAPSTTRHGATPPANAAAETATGGAAPQYVGRWMEGGRPAVVLSYQGRNVVVQVPGLVDGRYEVVSATERELVLRDIASATTQRIAFGAAAAAAAAPAGPVATAPSSESAEETAEETTPPVRVRPAKLPPPSQRTSDDVEPEN